MMTYHRALRVTQNIMDIFETVRGDYTRRKRIRELLVEEFGDERQQGVADRNDEEAMR
jgi:hypothetical protein